MGWDSPNNNHSKGVYYSPELFEFSSPSNAELTINGTILTMKLK